MGDRPFASDIQEIRRRAREHLERGPVTANYGGELATALRLLDEAVATEIVCLSVTTAGLLRPAPGMLHYRSMWLVLEGGVKSERARGGATVERECSMCGETAPFHEQTGAAPAEVRGKLEGQARLFACGACGERFATDELGAPELEAEVVEPATAGARSTALERTEGAPVAARSGAAASSSIDRPLGGSGGERRGLFARMGALFRSRASAAIERASDPAKEIEQLILEMEEEIRKGRDETKKLMATQKLAAARVVDLGKQSALWTERAEKAVRAGDDDLARQAIERRMRADQDLAEARTEQREAAGYAEKLRESLKRSEARLKEIKLKKGTIKAKVAGVRTAEVRADALGEFDRIAGKVDDSESEVEAEAELAADDSRARDRAVEAKLAALDRKPGAGGEIEDRLAALKRKMQEQK